MIGLHVDDRQIINVYDKLHTGKLGAHWLWVVISGIAAGIPEADALREFGYYEKPASPAPEAPHGWVLVPLDPCTPLPDYEECAHQASEATGLPSQYPSAWLSIFIREINRWCEHRAAAPEAMTDEPRTGYLSPDYLKGHADGQQTLRPGEVALQTFLDAAGGEGLVLGGVDAGDLYVSRYGYNPPASSHLNRASPAAPNEGLSQPNTAIEAIRDVLGDYLCSDGPGAEEALKRIRSILTANGAEAWKDVPRTGDWVADLK